MTDHHSDEPQRIPSQPPPASRPRRVPAGDHATANDVTSERTAAPGGPHGRRWFVITLIVLAAISGAYLLGISWLEHYLKVVSTEDAYVAGHLTYVSARVGSQVVDVLVEDNDYVEPGQILVRLDPEPFQIAVQRKQAALDVALARLEQARAQVRSDESAARGNWFAVVAAQEKVGSQLADLQATVAMLDLNKAQRVLAQKDYDRAARLLPSKSAT